MSFAADEDRGIGLSAENVTCRDGTAGAEKNPAGPSPARAVGYEASNDRPNGRPKHWSRGKHGVPKAVFVDRKQVSNDTSSDGEACGASNATEEAKHDYGGHVRGQGTTNLPEGHEALLITSWRP
ncbi:hypothetical protein MAP00_006568 [Monascus purpureus]|nr:hypothetical protein MAP00_006568 [Monascus purpureus]